MNSLDSDGRTRGIVSVWAGTFLSLEAAEAYFGMDVEVYLPPEGFLRDLGIDDFPAETLEVHFEQLSPRPIENVLKDATFSESFREQAAAAAKRQGIQETQGLALLYEFDYQATPAWRREAGPLTFIGSFSFVGDAARDEREPVRDPTIRVRDFIDDVL